MLLPGCMPRRQPARCACAVRARRCRQHPAAAAAPASPGRGAGCWSRRPPPHQQTPAAGREQTHNTVSSCDPLCTHACLDSGRLIPQSPTGCPLNLTLINLRSQWQTSSSSHPPTWPCLCTKTSEQPWQAASAARSPGLRRVISHNAKSLHSCEGATPAAAAAVCTRREHGR